MEKPQPKPSLNLALFNEFIEQTGPKYVPTFKGIPLAYVPAFDGPLYPYVAAFDPVPFSLN